MADKKLQRLNAVHGLNKYLYEKGLGAGVFLGTSVYKGRNPFVPPKQVEQFITMTQPGTSKPVPFIVYNWTISNVGSDYFKRTESVVYLVYSTEEDEVRRMTNFIHDTMNMLDRSATNVQAFIEKLPASQWGAYDRNPYLDFEYYSISVTGGNGGQPLSEEGDTMQAMITIDIDYGLVADSTFQFDEM